MSANGLGFGIGRMCVSKHYDTMYARRYDTMFARRWGGITLRSLCARAGGASLRLQYDVWEAMGWEGDVFFPKPDDHAKSPDR